MSEIVVKVENLSKAYQIGSFNSGTLSRDIERRISLFFGKDDPLKKIGETDILNKKEILNWSLKDINFEIKSGESYGIIGKNGAGKSTLLKILSQITTPTTGKIKVKGRVASLLEVGTGFHPELTGRENIYLNGAILGMNKFEIKKNFEEIVEFSAVSKYIDTPVKRYSSGMYVRLAFAIAAHLESEILIVDEVLAVGDAEFQQKCLGKMKNMSSTGRTVLFVSHNIESISRLCNNGILLHQGNLLMSGEISKITEEYLKLNNKQKPNLYFENKNNSDVGYISSIHIENNNGIETSEIPIGQDWVVKIRFRLDKKTDHFIAGFGLNSQFGLHLLTSWTDELDLDVGYYEVIFNQNELILTTGAYYLSVGLTTYKRTIDFHENILSFSVTEFSKSLNTRIVNTKSGILLNQVPYKINKL